MSSQEHILFTGDSFIDGDIRHFTDIFFSDAPTVPCHTSGSTGAPKDIRVKKSAMLYSAKNTVDFFGLDRSSLGLLCLPAKYIAGRMMLVRAYVSGMRLHSVNPSLNPLKNITHRHFDFAAFTPAQVVEILSDDDSSSAFSRIGHVIIGGAAVDAELEKGLAVFPNRIYATYGMTETVSHIALRRLGEKAYRKISSETRIGTDEEQCLWIADPNLSLDVLQTNDVVELLDESRFVWLGRRDFVINSGGVKLHPEQIEEKIKTIGAWAGRPFFIGKTGDAQFGERPVLVVLRGSETPALSSLQPVLDKREMPERIVEVERFVYTESGKLNRGETLNAVR